jgi:acyl-CoA thioester hydrolase
MEPLPGRGVGPILARSAIDYRRPAAYPDTVRVEATTTQLGRTSFTMAYRITSEGQEAEVAAGEDVIVVFDYGAGRPVPIPDGLREAIIALEGTGA